MAQDDKPPFEPLFHARRDDDLSSHRHRVVIGALGAALPLLVWLISWLRPAHPALTEPLSSISAYYYSGAVAVFTGILAGLAIYFFTYSGYDNAHHWKDRITAVIAGIAAIGVACFPTIAPSPPLELPWWHPYLGTIHFYCATALFGGFIVFALFLFPTSRRSRKDRPAAQEGAKRRLLRVRPDDAGVHGHRGYPLAAGSSDLLAGERRPGSFRGLLVGEGPRALDGEATVAPRAPAGDFRQARRAGGAAAAARAAVEHRTALAARSHDSSHLPCEARAPQSAQPDPVAPARVRVDVPSPGTSAESSGRATQPDAACADNGTCAESRRDEVGRCGCRSRRPGPGAGPARARGENRGGDLRCPTSPGPRSTPGVRCRSRSGQRPGCRHFDQRGCSVPSDAPSRGLRSIAFG